MITQKDLSKLENMMKSIHKVNRFLGGKSYEEYLENDMIADAILMHLINIGEKIHLLSEEFKNRFAHLPYREAKSMRNLIAHNYEAVSEKIIYQTCIETIPKLKLQIQGILDAESAS